MILTDELCSGTGWLLWVFVHEKRTNCRGAGGASLKGCLQVQLGTSQGALLLFLWYCLVICGSRQMVLGVSGIGFGSSCRGY